MQGPPDTPYENGTFELYCQFGPDYPVKPPTLRFVTVVSFNLYRILYYWCKRAHVEVNTVYNYVVTFS
jgi:hypothetical protein